MARLSLRLLGGFQLRAASGAAVSLPSRKARALIAYLAVRCGRTYSRDAMTALLWADVTDRQARHSLRQTLLDLRRVLGSPGHRRALIDGEELGLDPAAVDVDVVAFERLAGRKTLESLEQAAALYQGDLLEGLAIREPSFTEWLQAQRERLRETAVASMARLLDLQARGGSTEPAIRTAVQLLAVDPLQEAVHRTLMRLYERQGRRAAALRQYQVCVAVLQRELGVEPEPATKKLYRDTLQQQHARSPAAPSPPATVRTPRAEARARLAAHAAEAPLIGREAEMTRLRESLREAWRGQGRVLLLAGESGLGKSRLVEELRTEAGRQGGHALSGRFHESEQILPLRAWVDAFRNGGVVSDAAALEGLDPVWHAEAIRLFPELGEPGAPLPVTSETYVRLFEMMEALVAHLAKRRPVLLVLEDLHWADEMSLRLLSFLGRRIQRRAVLVVGTAADEDLAVAPVLRRSLEELEREGQLATVRLAPLSREDTLRLVRALGRAGSAEARIAHIAEQAWATSEGNPFVIVEIMRALQDGRLPETSSALPLPQRVRDVVTARLERLGDTSRQLAAAAAIIGRDFSFGLLQRAAALGERETAEGIEELVRRRVLDAVGEGFDFTHQRVRDVVAGNLLAPRQAAVHRAVGLALEALHAESLEDVYDRLAHHFRAAGDAARAFTYLVRVSDRAAQRYALEETARLLREARSYVDRLPTAERDARHLEITFRLAHTLTFLGRAPETLELLLKEEGRLERLGDPALSGHYHFWLAYSHGNLGHLERAAEFARLAVEEAARGGNQSIMGKANFVLAREAYYSGKVRQGVTYGRQAVAFLEPTTERWWLGHAHWILALNLYHLGDFAPALQELDRVREIGESIGDSRLRTFAAMAAGWVHALAGDHAVGIETCRRGLELSSDLLTRAAAHGFLGATHQEAGDARQAIALLEESRSHLGVLVGAGAFRYRELSAYFSAILAEAYLAEGRIAESRRLAESALDVAREGTWAVPRGYAQRVLGRLATTASDLGAAREHLRQALSTFEAIEARYQTARTLVILAEVDHRRGEHELAAQHVRDAHALFKLLRVPKYVARSEALARELAVAL